MLAREALHAHIGPPIDRIFRLLVPDADDAHVMGLVEAFRERYLQEGYAENVLYEGITGMLRSLGYMRLRCGVCTSKRQDIAERVLEHFAIAHHFALVDGGDVGIDKSDQLARLARDGRLAANAVMVGDRASDLEAAHANGLLAIGVAWGFGSRDELESARPFAIADSPLELNALLQARLF